MILAEIPITSEAVLAVADEAHAHGLGAGEPVRVLMRAQGLQLVACTRRNGLVVWLPREVEVGPIADTI